MSNQFKPLGLELKEGWVYEPEFLEKPFQNPQTGQNLSREEYEQFILHPNDVKWEGKWLSDETIQFLKGQINSGKSLYKLNFTTPGNSDAWHVDDLAKRLTALGISDLNQIGVKTGVGKDPIYSASSDTPEVIGYNDYTTYELFDKRTNQPLDTKMVGGKGSNVIGSTNAGKGYSDYRVQLDAFGSPVIVPEWNASDFLQKNPLLVQALSFAASFAIPGISQAIAPYISSVVGTAAAPAVSQFLVRTAVNTVFNGGDLGKAFVSAATGEILQGVTQAIGGAMVDSGIVNSMQTATAIASPMVSALNAVLRGEDPMKALVNGAVNSAVSSAISNYAISQKLDPTSKIMLQIGAAEAINYFRTGKFDPNALAMKFVGMGIGQVISQSMASAEAKDRIANMSVDAIRSIKADPVAMEAIRSITDDPDEILHAGKSQSEIDQIDLGEFNNGNLQATDEDVKQIWKSEFGEDPTDEQIAPLLGAYRDTLVSSVGNAKIAAIQAIKTSPEYIKKLIDYAKANVSPDTPLSSISDSQLSELRNNFDTAFDAWANNRTVKDIAGASLGDILAGPTSQVVTSDGAVKIDVSGQPSNYYNENRPPNGSFILPYGMRYASKDEIADWFKSYGASLPEDVYVGYTENGGRAFITTNPEGATKDNPINEPDDSSAMGAINALNYANKLVAKYGGSDTTKAVLKDVLATGTYGLAELAGLLNDAAWGTGLVRRENVVSNTAKMLKEWGADKQSDITKAQEQLINNEMKATEGVVAKSIKAFELAMKYPLGGATLFFKEFVQEAPAWLASGGVGRVFLGLGSKFLATSAALGTNAVLQGGEAFGAGFGGTYDNIMKAGGNNPALEEYAKTQALKTGVQALGISLISSGIADSSIVKMLMGDVTKISASMLAKEATKQYITNWGEEFSQNVSEQYNSFGKVNWNDAQSAGAMGGAMGLAISSAMIAPGAINYSALVAKDGAGNPVTLKEYLDGTKQIDPSTFNNNAKIAGDLTAGDFKNYSQVVEDDKFITTEEFFRTVEALRDAGIDPTLGAVEEIAGQASNLTGDDLTKAIDSYIDPRVTDFAEAKQMMKDLGYDNPTDDEVAQFAGVSAEVDAQRRIDEYVTKKKKKPAEEKPTEETSEEETSEEETSEEETSEEETSEEETSEEETSEEETSEEETSEEETSEEETSEEETSEEETSEEETSEEETSEEETSEEETSEEETSEEETSEEETSEEETSEEETSEEETSEEETSEEETSEEETSEEETSEEETSEEETSEEETSEEETSEEETSEEETSEEETSEEETSEEETSEEETSEEETSEEETSEEETSEEETSEEETSEEETSEEETSEEETSEEETSEEETSEEETSEKETSEEETSEEETSEEETSEEETSEEETSEEETSEEETSEEETSEEETSEEETSEEETSEEETSEEETSEEETSEEETSEEETSEEDTYDSDTDLETDQSSTEEETTEEETSDETTEEETSDETTEEETSDETTEEETTEEETTEEETSETSEDSSILEELRRQEQARIAREQAAAKAAAEQRAALALRAERMGNLRSLQQMAAAEPPQQTQVKTEEGKALEYLYDFGSILEPSGLRSLVPKPATEDKNAPKRAPIFAYSRGGAVTDYDAVTMELLKFLRG